MSFMISCPYCKECFQAEDEWEGKIAECPSCCKKIIIQRGTTGTAGNAETQDSEQGLKDKAEETFRKALNLEKLEGFSFSRFMRQMFKHHSWEETETYMAQGSPATTPPISEVEGVWPAPWLFGRVMIFTVAFAFLLVWQEDFFGTANIAMPYIIVCLIGIPFATLLFFWEANIPKNISLLSLVRIMLVSGFVSIAITLLIHKIIINPRDAIWAGPIEETAKMLTILLFIRNKKYKFILNGLLIGAAVGAGFEIVENGGYFINTFAKTTIATGGDIIAGAGYGFGNLLSRTASSVACHILWSAITGAALWIVKKDRAFSFSNLTNGRFLRLFACAIGLHMFFNSTILANQQLIKYAIIAVIGYAVVIHLIQEGINEVRTIKEKSGKGEAA